MKHISQTTEVISFGSDENLDISFLPIEQYFVWFCLLITGSVSGRLLMLHANLDRVASAAIFKPSDSATGGHTGVVR